MDAETQDDKEFNSSLKQTKSRIVFKAEQCHKEIKSASSVNQAPDQKPKPQQQNTEEVAIPEPPKTVIEPMQSTDEIDRLIKE